MSAPWVPEGKGYKCVRHGGAAFTPPATCPQCVDDTGEPLDVEVDAPLSKAPSGCMTTVQLERWYTALAKRSEKSAEAIRKRLETPAPASSAAPIVVFDATPAPEADAPAAAGAATGSFHDEIAIAKHRDTAIKAMRRAEVLAVRREDEEIVRRREKRQRKRDRGATN